MRSASALLEPPLPPTPTPSASSVAAPSVSSLPAYLFGAPADPRFDGRLQLWLRSRRNLGRGVRPRRHHLRCPGQCLRLSRSLPLHAELFDIPRPAPRSPWDTTSALVPELRSLAPLVSGSASRTVRRDASDPTFLAHRMLRWQPSRPEHCYWRDCLPRLLDGPQELRHLRQQPRLPLCLYAELALPFPQLLEQLLTWLLQQTLERDPSPATVVSAVLLAPLEPPSASPRPASSPATKRRGAVYSRAARPSPEGTLWLSSSIRPSSAFSHSIF